MKTFLAQTLCESQVTEDRFEITFLTVDGRKQLLSLPLALVSDLIPILQSAGLPASDLELTRLPERFAVGHAIGERKVLLRFDGEAPYAFDLEMAEALGRELSEQSEYVASNRVLAIH